MHLHIFPRFMHLAHDTPARLRGHPTLGYGLVSGRHVHPNPYSLLYAKQFYNIYAAMFAANPRRRVVSARACNSMAIDIHADTCPHALVGRYLHSYLHPCMDIYACTSIQYTHTHTQRWHLTTFAGLRACSKARVWSARPCA